MTTEFCVNGHGARNLNMPWTSTPAARGPFLARVSGQGGRQAANDPEKWTNDALTASAHSGCRLACRGDIEMTDSGGGSA